MKRFLIVLVGLVGFYMHISAQDNIKVMYYNILEYPLAPSSKADYLQTIFDYYHPDVLVCDEVVSDAIAVDILNNVINVTSGNNYAKAVFTDGPDKDNMIFFNQDKLSLDYQDIIPTALRYINRYRLHYNSATPDNIYLDFYAAHLKASQGFEQDRYLECVEFKNYISTNTQGQNIIFGGDFNLYTSTEPAYQLLLGPTNYSLYDPVNTPGIWNNNSTFAAVHTQSTHLATSGGFIGGGMDDRFDFILTTNDLLNSSNNVHYVTNSYKALGNDGLHFNKNITDLPLSTVVPDYVTSALYNMSDHLPVVMELAVNATSAVTNHLQFSNVSATGNTLINLAPFTVEVRNDLNQLISSYIGTITLSKLSGSGNLLGTTTVNAIGGIATFNDVRFDQAGTYKITCSATGISSANTDNIVITAAVPTMTELVVPKYIGSKTAASTNNARTPFAACIQIDNLVPLTQYNLKAGIGLTTDAATLFGAGSIWNGTDFSVQTLVNAFTTNSNGSSGPVWIFIQPTGNGTRFDAGQTHNLRIGYYTGTSSPGSPAFIGTKTITALDISTTPRTTETTDDGAFVKGSADPTVNGKYVVLFDNEAGTGDPLFAYQVRNTTPTNPLQSQLPTAVDEVYNQSGASIFGDYPAVIPIGANNPNGVRRIESRNADNTIFGFNTDADGIWPSGANTTTIGRRNVASINSTEAPLIPTKTINLTILLEGLYNGSGTMRKAMDEFGDHFPGATADQITVELHNAANYSTVVYAIDNVNLSTNGNTSFTLPSSFNGSYYITIKHRNSITSVSALPVSFNNSTIAYNFSDAVSKVYGNNQLQTIDGKWVIIVGDVNQDGTIDSGDMVPVDNGSNAYASGYLPADINGDGTIDSGDMILIDNNGSSYLNSQTP
jgi:hypothetical protein